MTGIFRKLRKYFLSQGKARQYLAYALGEILLVTIGILIAIQINGLYEDSADRKKEKEYLEAYRADLLNKLVELDRVICKREETIQRMDSLLQWSQRKQIEIPIDTIESHIVTIGFYTIFQSSDGTIEDILASGDVNIIQDDRLRQSIVSWESNIKFTKEWERLGQDSAQEGMDFMTKHIPLYKNGLNQQFLTEELLNQLMKDTYFLNMVDNQKVISNQLNPLYIEIRNTHWELLEILDKKIEQL